METIKDFTDKLKKILDMNGSKRRSRLGVGVAFWENQSWYHRNQLAKWIFGGVLPDKFVCEVADDLEGGWLRRNDVFALQRNGKKALAMRSVDDLSEELRKRLDQRRDWNQENRAVETVLDLFPSFKYSYSSMLPQAHRSGFVDLVVSEKGKARVADVARSHSIWLDPVDAPKELYKHRLRIDRIIKWVYKNNFVPVLMTLTIYHRWNNLDGLNRVLGDAWRDLLSSYSGRRRGAAVELQGWIRRLEININDGVVNSNGEFLPNSGFHPHYHALLIVPRDKLELLSDAEQEWREAWVNAVCKRFESEFSEKVDESFLPAFREHGLVFSRVYDSDKKSYGALRAVDTGDYLAKIMGYDPVEIYGGNEKLAKLALALNRDERTYTVYGIDDELASINLKSSKIPFDLIRDPSLPAANVDLWVEYAIATKGVPAVQYSHGLEKRVNDYFEEHLQSDDSYKICPSENVVASLDRNVYQLLYRNFKLNELYEKVAEGYDALCSWLESTFVRLGVPELCSCPIAMPRPPAPTVLSENEDESLDEPPD